MSSIVISNATVRDCARTSLFAFRSAKPTPCAHEVNIWTLKSIQKHKHDARIPGHTSLGRSFFSTSDEVWSYSDWRGIGCDQEQENEAIVDIHTFALVSLGCVSDATVGMRGAGNGSLSFARLAPVISTASNDTCDGHVETSVVRSN